MCKFLCYIYMILTPRLYPTCVHSLPLMGCHVVYLSGCDHETDRRQR
uniref:Uncharacterized protein n=1 Tax=Manihot esculenta TaxID=3983 RepID=A0A2C9UMG4_MANES